MFNIFYNTNSIGNSCLEEWRGELSRNQRTSFYVEKPHSLSVM